MVIMADGYTELAELIRALAHPTRLRILDILAQRGECCVCHLTAVLEQRQPYVSQQLMVLREKGLVSDRKDGVMVYYRLADARTAALLALSRELLRRSGQRSEFLDVPESPVEGCPCPACTPRSP